MVMPLSREGMRLYMKRRYHERRRLALKRLGGKCACGSAVGLEIDHVDPKKKTMRFTQMRCVSLAKFERELKNCQLLCNTCHKKKTRVDASRGHGAHGAKRYRKGCRCSACCAGIGDARRRARRKKALQADQVIAPP
jgi:5-methylcytosine-specific restriction endonuclease McrA